MKSRVIGATSALVLVQAFLQIVAPAQAQASGVISRESLRPFASAFHCSNPVLDFQFKNTPTLYSENQRMRAASDMEPENFVFQASDVGGEGDWLYRGVTNRQFNESQILAVIFNDEVAVSESRWFSDFMFKKTGVSQDTHVETRAKFRNLPHDVKVDAFKEALTTVKSKILRLISSGNASENGFTPHLTIGNDLNGTPQAIQFLTPHKEYAEMYGEFVLHVRETVRRGVDVERWNYHNGGYRIGEIYSHDADEYLVPSHIPGWDVQVVKVRTGTGWHQVEKYGDPIYYFTKIHEPKNPCNVSAISVDVPSSDGEDAHRTPVGYLLKCSTGDCSSDWASATGRIGSSALARLKGVVSSTKIDGKPIFFQSIENSLNFLDPMQRISLYSKLPQTLKNRKEYWEEQAYLLGFRSPDVAFSFMDKIKGDYARFARRLIGAPRDRLEEVEPSEFIAWVKLLAATSWNAKMKPEDFRPIIHTVLSLPAYASYQPSYTLGLSLEWMALLNGEMKRQAPMGVNWFANPDMSDLKGQSFRIQPAATTVSNPTRKNTTVAQTGPSGAALKEIYVSRGEEALIRELSSSALSAQAKREAVVRLMKAFSDGGAGSQPKAPLALWNRIQAIAGFPKDAVGVKDHFIDAAIAGIQGSGANFDQVCRDVVQAKLPKEREGDTARALWSKAKILASAKPALPLQFLSGCLPELLAGSWNGQARAFAAEVLNLEAPAARYTLLKALYEKGLLIVQLGRDVNSGEPLTKGFWTTSTVSKTLIWPLALPLVTRARVGDATVYSQEFSGTWMRETAAQALDLSLLQGAHRQGWAKSGISTVLADQLVAHFEESWKDSLSRGIIQARLASLVPAAGPRDYFTRVAGLAQVSANAAKKAATLALSKKYFPEGPSTIVVTRATYGTNNVTQHAAAFCRGKTSVTYKVTPEHLGLTEVDEDAGFTLSYRCSNDEPGLTRQAIRYREYATGETFSINCR